MMNKKYFVHESVYVDAPCEIGEGTKIWHYSHIMKDCCIGKNCVLGQNVHIANEVIIGNNVKMQNNVSLYQGIIVEDNVFLGPSCVVTNVTNPRSEIVRHQLFEETILKKGCSIGANATVLCGITIGRYAFVGAGSVVTKSVSDYSLVVGTPARHVGWISRHGHKLLKNPSDDFYICPESSYKYQEVEPGLLRCLDLDEESAMPEEHTRGKISYKSLKKG